MSRPRLALTLLPAWQRLNGVDTTSKTVDTAGKGYGLVFCTSDSDFAHDGQQPPRPFLSVPGALVVNAEQVLGYAKEDANFAQLLARMEYSTPREHIVLFLLVQMVVGMQRAAGVKPVCQSTAWTEYVQFLSDEIPTPTLWPDSERLLLQGTSLEEPLEAKLVELEREFDRLRDVSATLLSWRSLWEEDEADKAKNKATETKNKAPSVAATPQLHHWFLADAWYRSRCLDLPTWGHCLVPCIDMANHSATPNAYYDELAWARGPAADGGLCDATNHDGRSVVLFPCPGVPVAEGDEITINYSGRGRFDATATTGSRSSANESAAKSAAELLYSYGFIDPASARPQIEVPLRLPQDDPLLPAKSHVFGNVLPRVQVSLAEGGGSSRDKGRSARWSCPFAYLLCVNEEDGLDFLVRQSVQTGDEQDDSDSNNARELRVVWQGEDVTESARDFASLTRKHELAAVFELRVVMVLIEALEARLERMRASAEAAAAAASEGDGDNNGIRAEVAEQVKTLTGLETEILKGVLSSLMEERTELLQNATVLAYLGSMEAAQSELAAEQTANETTADETTVEEDFS